MLKRIHCFINVSIRQESMNYNEYHFSVWCYLMKHFYFVHTSYGHPSAIAKKVKITISTIFIIKVFRTIVFIFIVISTTFRPICPPGFFRCLSNSGTFTELRTTSFIETTGVACSDSVCHDRVQVLSIPVYYSPGVRIEPATYNLYAMCPAGHMA